jgi:hypothetical protein
MMFGFHVSDLIPWDEVLTFQQEVLHKILSL